MDPAALPYSLHKNGLCLCVRAKPGANRLRKPQLVDIGEGKIAVEIAVSAPPEGGRANKAICEQLATHLGLKKNLFSIKAGQTGRIKTVLIEGETAQLSQVALCWISSL